MLLPFSSPLGLLAISLLASICLGTGSAEISPYPKLSADSETTIEVTQILSLFGFLLDTKNFSALNYVFTDDVVVDSRPLSGTATGNPSTGLASLEKFYERVYFNQTTQHVSESVLVYDLAQTTAKAVSYQSVVYFGQGALLGQIATFYEKLDDDLVKVDGSWRISARTLILFVSFSTLRLWQLAWR